MSDPATRQAACRRRIYRNQARHLERKFPHLRALGVAVADDTAEKACTIYSGHIKRFDPLAAENMRKRDVGSRNTVCAAV